MIDTSPERFEYVPFPSGVLPEPLKTFVRTTAVAFSTDQTFVALPLLSTVAGIIGMTRRIVLRPGWREPCILWTCTIGESGTGKSPAYRAALAPLERIEDGAWELQKQTSKMHEEDQDRFEQDLKAWKTSECKGDRPEPPPEPTATRYMTSDMTIEALAPILEQNPRGILSAPEELSGWFGRHDRYAKTRGGDVPAWLNVHDGGPIRIDRKTSPPIYVPRAAVSIAGTIQPSVLGACLGEMHLVNGMAPRFLFGRPPRRKRQWSNIPVPAGIQEQTILLFEQLAELKMNPGPDGILLPVDVALTDQARDLYIPWWEDRQDQLSAMIGPMAAWWSKLNAVAARVALLVHMVRVCMGDRMEDPGRVDGEDIMAGRTLAQWFGDQARRLMIERDEDEGETRTRVLVETIRGRGGNISVRDLQHSSTHYKTANDARADLTAMEVAGIGKLDDVPAGERGGRPSEVFTLFPQYLDKTQEPPPLAIAPGGFVGFGIGNSKNLELPEGESGPRTAER